MHTYTRTPRPAKHHKRWQIVCSKLHNISLLAMLMLLLYIPTTKYHSVNVINSAQTPDFQLASLHALTSSRCPHLDHTQFYVESPFCCNPPNLSWLGTGTEQRWPANLVVGYTICKITAEHNNTRAKWLHSCWLRLCPLLPANPQSQSATEMNHTTATVTSIIEWSWQTRAWNVCQFSEMFVRRIQQRQLSAAHQRRPQAESPTKQSQLVRLHYLKLTLKPGFFQSTSVTKTCFSATIDNFLVRMTYVHKTVSTNSGEHWHQQQQAILTNP